MANKLYRPAEAQDILGIRPTKFWAMVKEGTLKTTKIGARICLVTNLDEYIESLKAAV